MTVDVSRGGFSTNVMRVLPPNTQFEGTIHYDGRDETFTGRVVWARPGNPRLNMNGAMGVRFEAVSQSLALAMAGPETEQGRPR
jgi:hypothetical protein